METKQPHPLASWMDSHPEISQAKLASETECSEPHLSLILQRKRGVSMKLAQRLSVATGGAVRIEDFLLDEPREAAQ
jgi:plasmid maintenance system antidote protein VapI